MKSEMKRALKDAFEAPEPKHKKEFLKELEQPQISTVSFLLSQVSYIRKSVWIGSVFVAILAVLWADAVGEDSVWVISAMMPFVALCGITEGARSETYQMAELEMASRFSLKSITLARLGAIGVLHFILYCILILLAGKSQLVSFGQVGIYLLVPYLLTSVLGLVAVRKVHGKESIYICMGIAVMVSGLHLIVKGVLPEIYEEKQLIWWIAVGVYLLVKAWGEYKKMIYQTEELAWN